MEIIMEQFQNFIKPELLVLIPVLYCIGIALKRSDYVQDEKIPMLLGLVGVCLSALWIGATTVFHSYQDALMAVFAAITQGVLCAGASVYFHQMIKQYTKKQKENGK